MQVPEPGYITDAKIEKIGDGDTVVVSVTKTFAVRLTEDGDTSYSFFDAPEKNTGEGQDVIEFLKQALFNEDGSGKTVRLHIPTKNSIYLMDIQSFNRILGKIWLDGQLLTDILREKGMGKTKKNK